MAEWSNATDLSSVSFGSAGSNPAGANSRISHSKFIIVYLKTKRNEVRQQQQQQGPIAQLVRARCL